MNKRIQPSELVETYFAPAGRDTSDEFRRRVAIVNKNPLLRAILSAFMPGMVLVLNANRQIVSANETVLRTLNVAIEDVFGKKAWRGGGLHPGQTRP